MLLDLLPLVWKRAKAASSYCGENNYFFTFSIFFFNKDVEQTLQFPKRRSRISKKREKQKQIVTTKKIRTRREREREKIYENLTRLFHKVKKNENNKTILFKIREILLSINESKKLNRNCHIPMEISLQNHFIIFCEFLFKETNRIK